MSFFDYPGADDGDVRPEDHERSFLPGCSEQDWSLLLSHTSSRPFRASEVIIDPTDAERALYIVIEGILEVLSAERRRGRSRRLATLDPGTVVGELSFFDGRARSARVVAVTDGELARFGLDDLEALALERPDLARAILFDLGRLVARQLRDLQSHLAPSLT